MNFTSEEHSRVTKEWIDASILAKRVLMSSNVLEEDNVRDIYTLYNEIFRPRVQFSCLTCSNQQVIRKFLEMLEEAGTTEKEAYSENVTNVQIEQTQNDDIATDMPSPENLDQQPSN